MYRVCRGLFVSRRAAVRVRVLLAAQILTCGNTICRTRGFCSRARHFSYRDSSTDGSEQVAPCAPLLLVRLALGRLKKGEREGVRRADAALRVER
jgi:hypothetical protein